MFIIKPAQDVMQSYTEIGEILARYDIGCTSCKVGICLLKDVVSIHVLSNEDEAKIDEEINNQFSKYNIGIRSTQTTLPDFKEFLSSFLERV